MTPASPNLVIAALGPFAELLGVAVLVALFTLLRSQADRRPYFQAWERSWVMLAAGLACGVVFQRLTDRSSTLYASSHFMPWLFAAGYLAFRLLALALFLAGARLLVSGTPARLLVRAAVPVAVALSLATDTFNGRLGSLALLHGPLALAVYAYAAALFSGLPPSRRSAGGRLAALATAALAVLWTGLVAFHLAARLDAALSAEPWFVRFERYAFYADLLLQFALAYAMVRLLFEDGEREALDTRAQLELLQDLPRMTEFHDAPTGLLNRHAFDMSVGLDFARASFGSVVRVRLANFEREAAAHGAAVGETLLKHFAGVLGSSVRTHDRVYRWDARDFMVVMPRAVPDAAKDRIGQVVSRAAPVLAAGVHAAIRAEAESAVAPFTGGEDLAAAVAAVASGSGSQ